MKTSCKFLGLMIFGIGLFVVSCAEKQPPMWQSIKNPEVTAQLKSFVAEKEAQANAATNEAPSGFAPFFAAAKRGDWLTVSNAFEDFRKHAGQYEHSGKADERLRGTAWEAVKEIWGAFYFFGSGDDKYSAAFGNDIIHSIPAGSIYFGGTDPGRFVVTAMQKSHVNGDPFFGLTQNALADSTYLDYVRGMYGGKIYIPTSEDLQKCFQDYTEDAEKRLKNHQLKPGENVTRGASGHVQVSGQFAVTQIDGLLAEVVFDKNPDREFYIEESFPFDWMYPYLEPHGLIMKISRDPMPRLSDDVVERDHDYWTKCVAAMLGDWLSTDTTVSDYAAFTKKVYAKHNLSGFKGDPIFIRRDDAQKMFSKLRSSIAGVYAWRVQHATTADAKERMAAETDFAFRQAWVLCPYSQEAIFRYVNFLLEQKRTADALLVAETAVQVPALQGKDGAQVRTLVEQLKKLQKAK